MCMCSLRLAQDYAQAVNQSRIQSISSTHLSARLTASSRQSKRERTRPGDHIKRPGSTAPDSPVLAWIHRFLHRALPKVYT